jgi:hypothetical protein
MGERIDSRYLRKIPEISKASIVRVEAGERLNAALSLVSSFTPALHIGRGVRLFQKPKD